MRVQTRSKGTDSIGLDTQNIRQASCLEQLSPAYRRTCSENWSRNMLQSLLELLGDCYV